MVVWGLAYQLVIIAALTYRQQVTPEPLLSRVNTAGRMISWGVGWTLGSLAAGALAEHVGIRPAMLALVASGVVAAIFAWLSPLPGSRAAPGHRRLTSPAVLEVLTCRVSPSGPWPWPGMPGRWP